MTPTPEWETRLNNLIKKHNATIDGAAFRNQFRDLTAEAARRLPAGSLELLTQIRDVLEQWVASDPPPPSTARDQFLQLLRDARGNVPDSTLYALARRLPNSAEPSDWTSFILQSRDAQLMRIFLNTGVIRAETLRTLAQERPEELYLSAGLDALLERNTVAQLPGIWRECEKGAARPPSLLPREAVVVRLYANSTKEQADSQMLALLVRRTVDQKAVFELLLDDQSSALRLCRYLLFGHSTKRVKPERATAVSNLLTNWLQVCDIASGAKSKQTTATLVAALIRLAGFEYSEAPSVSGPWAAAAQMTEKAILRVLQDDDTSSRDATQTIFTITGRELHWLLQQHLNRVPQNTIADGVPHNLAAKHERYLGSKEVIVQVLNALDEVPASGALPDALEVALFNCGVRALGDVGATTQFNPHWHQADAPGILSGEPVVIARPGRMLGRQDDGVVLRKAIVRRARAGAEGQGDEE